MRTIGFKCLQTLKDQGFAWGSWVLAKLRPTFPISDLKRLLRRYLISASSGTATRKFSNGPSHPLDPPPSANQPSRGHVLGKRLKDPTAPTPDHWSFKKLYLTCYFGPPQNFVEDGPPYLDPLVETRNPKPCTR
jgi:hypothetical protein